MKKKALTKEFFMSIKKTYNRFISICLIVMLGTAFFAGVKAAEPDMQESADIFFDDSKLMDIRVLSTLGLTEDDVTAISAIEGVESAIPVYTSLCPDILHPSTCPACNPDRLPPASQTHLHNKS